MLNAEDNELLCRVGPGTPMGNLFRQYWLPAIRSDELAAPDCPPLRVRLLGEDLIGFRTTSGAVGLIQNACPHRGASLFFGRNEEEGLRCVYHGWKFDTAGSCSDMPSEPAESNFRSKVHARAYPTRERNGIVWAYLGPRETPPPLPELEGNMHESCTVTILYRANNWMQGIEGELDTVHAAFLHGGAGKLSELEPGSFPYYEARNRAGKFSARETEFGNSYGMYREAEEDTYYWRIGHLLFPCFAMPPGSNVLGLNASFIAYVPMDDYNTLEWGVSARLNPAQVRQTMPGPNRPGGGNARNYLPNTSGWHGRFVIDQNLGNDFLIDREAQKNWQSYTGIPGGRQQDMAMTETMGPIYDRSHEHLGTTDQMIIRTRRALINAAKALRDRGVTPPGVDTPQVYHQRSGQVILPRNVDWWEETRALRERFEVQPPRQEVLAAT
jgi:phenylpropionate dioxygenase-like ring-hydroxylating dioxygenase large terminal subunit